MARKHAWWLVVAGLTASLIAGCGRGHGQGQVGPLGIQAPKPASMAAGAGRERVDGPGASLEAQAPSLRLTPGEAKEGEWIVAFKGEGRRELPGATLKEALGVKHAFVVEVKRGAYRLQAAELVESWDELPEVDYVEPNYLYAVAGAPTFGNDPGAAEAWGVAAIQAPSLWALTVGAGPVVAVLDTGVAPHADLAGRLLPGKDLVDQDNDPRDPHGHGTHVAGIVAAAAGNALASVGVAPGASILPIRVLDANGRGTNANIAAGIREAVRRGAKIINLSLGGAEASETLKRAIQDAQAAGVVVVAASGNEGVNTPFYPAAFPGVIAVGAHDLNVRRASFSNHGAYLSLAAPGVGIGSLALDGGTRSLSGTSMASPHVAGAAALLLSSFPKLSAANLLQVMQAGGRATAGFEGGKVKALDVEAAFAAVGALDLSPPSEVTQLVASPSAPGEVRLSWSAASDNRGVARYRIRRNGQMVGESHGTEYLDRGMSGMARYAVQAVDGDGNEGPWSAEVSGQEAAASMLFDEVKVVRATDSITIRWKTRSPMRTCVQWGSSAQLGENTPWEGTARVEHEVKLRDLKRFTLHHFRLVAIHDQGAMEHSEVRKVRTKMWWLFQAQ